MHCVSCLWRLSLQGARAKVRHNHPIFSSIFKQQCEIFSLQGIEGIEGTRSSEGHQTSPTHSLVTFGCHFINDIMFCNPFHSTDLNIRYQLSAHNSNYSNAIKKRQYDSESRQTGLCNGTKNCQKVMVIMVIFRDQKSTNPAWNKFMCYQLSAHNSDQSYAIKKREYDSESRQTGLSNGTNKWPKSND